MLIRVGVTGLWIGLGLYLCVGRRSDLLPHVFYLFITQIPHFKLLPLLHRRAYYPHRHIFSLLLSHLLGRLALLLSFRLFVSLLGMTSANRTRDRLQLGLGLGLGLALGGWGPMTSERLAYLADDTI